VGAPIDRLSKRIKVRSVAGDPNEMVRLTAAGDGAMISDNFATLHRIRLGDMLELPAPDGLFRLRVVGINEDYSDQQGAILIDRSLYNRVWKDETSNVFRIYLRRGQDAAAVRQMILDRLGGRSRLFVLTNDELRRFVMHLTEQWFGITYVQIFVAVLVAVLGIVNTLTVSIADRRRELGVLQAVGALRNQVRGAIWMEAATISALGLVLGYALGAFNLYYILEVTRRDLAGLRLDYRYPVETAAALIPVMLAVAWLAALGPGESAVRGSLVEALEYE
jgi:putative ABC transport system permease protein